MWHWPKKQCSVMSALIRSQDRARSLFWQMRLRIRVMWRRICFPRRNMTRWLPRSLMTTSQELAEKVSEEVDGFVAELSRKEIIQKSLDQFGYILVADAYGGLRSTTANEIASEHLEIVTVNPFEVMTKIRNAGAIFLGEYSSEPLGDYFAGPNHVLPTNGTAKFFSPLGVDAFVKKSSIISYSREASAADLP